MLTATINGTFRSIGAGPAQTTGRDENAYGPLHRRDVDVLLAGWTTGVCPLQVTVSLHDVAGLSLTPEYCSP